MQSSRLRQRARFGRFDGDEDEKCYASLCFTMLVSLSVIVHLGLRIVGVVCFRGDISQTFDAVTTACRLYDVRLRYVYTPMVNQVQNNSTLAVGLTIKILPPQVGAGLENSKKPTSHMDDVIQKIKWRGPVSSIQPI
jgi:hypothetical protein